MSDGANNLIYNILIVCCQSGVHRQAEDALGDAGGYRQIFRRRAGQTAVSREIAAQRIKIQVVLYVSMSKANFE